MEVLAHSFGWPATCTPEKDSISSAPFDRPTCTTMRLNKAFISLIPIANETLEQCRNHPTPPIDSKALPYPES